MAIRLLQSCATTAATTVRAAAATSAWFSPSASFMTRATAMPAAAAAAAACRQLHHIPPLRDDKPEAGSRAEAEALFGGVDGRPMGGGEGGGSPGGGRQGARYQASAAHSANILEGGPQVNRVSSYSPAGFTVNDTRMQGAVALFPGLQLMWKVQRMEDITVESLELFVRMNPKIDVLVLGSGDKIEFVPPPIREYLRQSGVTIEVQGTKQACATYNFLSEEGRRVAAALLPPTIAKPKPRMWSPTSNATGQF